MVCVSKSDKKIAGYLCFVCVAYSCYWLSSGLIYFPRTSRRSSKIHIEIVVLMLVVDRDW